MKKTLSFNSFSGRKSSLNSLNENRFENINKDPTPHTKVYHIPTIQFSKQTKRPQEVFGKPKSTLQYDIKINQVKSRIDVGIPDIGKLAPRKSNESLMPIISVIDPAKVMKAHSTLSRSPIVAKFELQKPRDNLYLQTTDRWKNN